MLDVILYRHDRQGRLTLEERLFQSLAGLAQFFGTAESARWEWAEVETVDEGGSRRTVRYPAEALRRGDFHPRALNSGRTPPEN